MRILCDQHVEQRYVHTLQRADGITVTTVRHVMHADASDSDIASSAAASDWLVLTSDEDLLHRTADPRPAVLPADRRR